MLLLCSDKAHCDLLPDPRGRSIWSAPATPACPFCFSLPLMPSAPVELPLACPWGSRHVPAYSRSPVICLSDSPPSSLCSTVTFSLAPILITLLRIPTWVPWVPETSVSALLPPPSAQQTHHPNVLSSYLFSLSVIYCLSPLPCHWNRTFLRTRIIIGSAHWYTPRAKDRAWHTEGAPQILVGQTESMSGRKHPVVDSPGWPCAMCRPKHFISFNPQNSHMA